MSRQVEGLEKLGVIIPKGDFANLRTYNTRKELLTINLKNDDLSGLQKSLDTFKPDVVILDPISRIATFNMRKSECITQFVNLMIKMRDCVWVLVHHPRKEESRPIWTTESKKSFKIDREALFDSIRGSSNWPNFADTIIVITPSDPFNLPKNYLKIFFESRRGVEAMPLEVKWDNKFLNYELIDITDLHKKMKLPYPDMIEYLKKNFRTAKYKHSDLIEAISKEFRCSVSRASQRLSEAKENGDMIKEKGTFGKWYISDQGKLF